MIPQIGQEPNYSVVKLSGYCKSGEPLQACSGPTSAESSAFFDVGRRHRQIEKVVNVQVENVSGII